MYDTMYNFKHNMLDEYTNNKESFKGIDIENWCKRNIDEEDFNISFMAKEIYDHYYKTKYHPNPRSYYYITYCLSRTSKYFYELIKDPILSPDKTKYIPKYKIISLYRSIKEIDSSIRNNKYKEDYDIKEIEKINKIFSRRCRKIIHSNFSIDRYDKYSDKEKVILELMLKDKKTALENIYCTLECMEEK